MYRLEPNHKNQRIRREKNMISFTELAAKIFGGRRETSKTAIAELEQEFTGVVPIELPSFNYRPSTPAEKEQPVFRMSRQAVEIIRVPGAVKGKGERLVSHFVYQPNDGDREILEMTNDQEDEELNTSSVMRFDFPPTAKKQVFTSTGTAKLYVKGANGDKWIFGMSVSCSIRETTLN
jgi:hypothetical protein